MWVYVEALPLQASLMEMNVPLDRIRAARQQLSFIWCSVLAAVSLLVVLHLFAAAFQRFLVAGKLRQLFHAPSPPPRDIQSPAADEPDTQCDSAPTEAAVTADHTTVGKERHSRHRRRVPSSDHSALQSPPSTTDGLWPPYERSRRLQFPTTTTSTAAEQRWSPKLTHRSPMNIEGIYYTDSVIESNV